MYKIAIVDLTSLEAYSMSEVLRTYGNIDTIATLGITNFDSTRDSFDAYVVSEALFISSLEFFMPRKSKTIIICRSRHETDTKRNPANNMIIYSDSDMQEISEMCARLMSALNDSDEPAGGLSQREIEVLRQIVSGKTNKEIADALFISINTVITHRKNISSKLGIRSASGLSLYALMNGLI